MALFLEIHIFLSLYEMLDLIPLLQVSGAYQEAL